MDSELNTWLKKYTIAGNEFIIARSGKSVVRLVPYTQQMNDRQPGQLKGKIQLPNDFDSESKEINALISTEEKIKQYTQITTVQ